MRKPSFLQRLTGAIPPEEYDDLFEETPEQDSYYDEPRKDIHLEPNHPNATPVHNEVHHPGDGHEHPDMQHVAHEEEEGELAVDIYQTPEEIVVKALVAGVKPDAIDISVTRDMVTVKGHREEHKEVTEENYFYKELYWGGFTRTILLPEEVDVDMAEASTNHGILMVRLPKINKDRKTKLKVKAR